MARKIYKITADVLKVLATIGVVILAGSSPRFFPVLIRDLEKRSRRFGNDYSKKDIEQAVIGLKRSKLVVVKEKGGKFFAEVTDKGKKRLNEINVDELKNKTPKDWDGLWRIVIFDIPEAKRPGRNALRCKMKELGFWQLQKSVWVFPYDCEKEIQLLVEAFEIDSFVNFVVAKKIHDDIELKKNFGLV